MSVQSDWHKTKFFFLGNPVKLGPNWQNLRAEGKKILSPEAQLKLEWIIFYHTQANKNAILTAKHFGISRKTVHKWLKRYHDAWLSGLEEKSTAPLRTRTRDISLTQRVRVKSLRLKYPKYGKLKLVSIYKQNHGEIISSWKIQKIIEEGNLYYDQPRVLKRRKRRLKSIKKQKITNLVMQHKANFLWHVDTVVLALSSGGYRYLLTAIDDVSKMAYARLYATHTSRNAKDFLERLVYVTDHKILNIHTDNGSEFAKEFEQACRALNLPHLTVCFLRNPSSSCVV